MEVVMKRALMLSLAAAIGVAGTSAFAGDDAGSWYLSPMLQYHLMDNDKALKDNFGYQAGVGYNLPDAWAIEGNFSQGDFGVKSTAAARRLSVYSIDIAKKFLPDSMFQPYAIAGGGELDDRLIAPGFGARTFHTYMAEAGVGLLTGIGSQKGSTRVQLRTEAKYRMEWANASRFGVKDPSNLILGIGVQMNFGAPNEIPPVIKEVVREV